MTSSSPSCSGPIRRRWVTLPLLIVACGLAPEAMLQPAFADVATAYGEIEGRPAPVARRQCVGGTLAGSLCNEDTDCPGSICVDRNVFNLSVAVNFNATNAQLTAIQDLITAGSEALFDATDGQAEIGMATIHNNAYSTDADILIQPASDPTWWWTTNTGGWQIGGLIEVSINYVLAETAPGETLAHELVHLLFDARDEYEDRPDCDVDHTPGFSCPDSDTIDAGETSCLMDNGGIGAEGAFSELCWGQGDPDDLTDVTGGIHDATNVTEQSQCRDNRSCWAQVVHSWPNTFLMPAGAPDPAANGAVVNPTEFVFVDNAIRVVLVLDESGSMSLESPSRMARLKVAAGDFVTLSEDGSEVGIVSYSDDAEIASGRVNVAIDALGADRSDWTDAIDDLSPDSRTNISAGLDRAHEMITDAGGVTGNTFIVLMSDGLNNEPKPQATADAELEAKVDELLDAGIEVYVTCTGSDLGLDSQCSEIGAGTGGFYVDSADAARLPEAFVDFHERISRRQAIHSREGFFYKSETTGQTVYVEEGSESVTFTLIWENPLAAAAVTIIDPDGNQHATLAMPQGRYARFRVPQAGEWRIALDPRGKVDSRYVARAYSRNRIHHLKASARHASVLPGQEIYLYAYPRSAGGAISHASETIAARVTLPDGSTDVLELHDRGRDLLGAGDDIPDDGVFTGVYRNTSQKGAYRFLLGSDLEGWKQPGDRPRFDPDFSSPRFVREVLLSAAVGDPRDIEPDPEDGLAQPDRNCRWLWWLVVILLVLLILCLLTRRRRPRHP